MYISITGLQLKRPWHWFRFYRHAAPCLRAAKRADGNLVTKVKNINGVRHTVTAWESRNHMMAYIHSEPHRSAIKAFPAFAVGKTLGYEGDTVPGWDEVHQKWQEAGNAY